MTTTATDDARPAQASTLPTRRPGTHRTPPSPRPTGPPGYDLDRAWHLLAATRELPATQRGLLKILTEYRKALHALATQLQATQRAQQPPDPGTPPCNAGVGDSQPGSHDHAQPNPSPGRPGSPAAKFYQALAKIAGDSIRWKTDVDDLLTSRRDW